MTIEERKLLLKDLCARLPYKCKYKASKEITHWHKLTLSAGTIDKIIDDYYDDIKPYLRPMSSMTEEEEIEYNDIVKNTIDFYDCPKSKEMCFFIVPIDWLNAHHFDYHGLIEKGLALEAPEGMYE